MPYVNDIYLTLFARIGAVDYHWAIHHVTGAQGAAIRYHVEGSSLTCQWVLAPPSQTTLIASTRCLVNIRIGRSLDPSTFPQRVCNPELVRQGDRAFTCRTWALSVIDLLIQNGEVELKPGKSLRDLELEAWNRADYQRQFRPAGAGPLEWPSLVCLQPNPFNSV